MCSKKIRGGTAELTPIEDKCERCFCISCKFPAKTWEEIKNAALTQGNSVLGSQVLGALAKSIAGEVVDADAPQSITLSRGTELEAFAPVMLKSESSLKKAAGGIHRLPKGAMKNVPRCLLPRFDGKEGTELYYVFMDDECDTITGRVRLRVGV